MDKRNTLSMAIIVLASQLVVESAMAFYSPSTGRFVSRDPIGEQGGLNQHAFVENRPTNAVDPDGRAVVGVGGWLNIGDDGVNKIGEEIERQVNAWRTQMNLPPDPGYEFISGSAISEEGLSKIESAASAYRDRRFSPDGSRKCHVEGFVLFGYSDGASSIYRLFQDNHRMRNALTVKEPVYSGDTQIGDGLIAAISYLALIDMVRLRNRIIFPELWKSEKPYNSFRPSDVPGEQPDSLDWQIPYLAEIYYQWHDPLLWKGYRHISHVDHVAVHNSSHGGIIHAGLVQQEIINNAVEMYKLHVTAQLRMAK